MRRKRAAGVAALMATAVLLTGCGGGEGTSAGEPERVVFWGWAKGTKEMVAAFNTSHTDVQIAYEEIPSGTVGGYAKFSNAIKAGNAPDLMAVEYAQVPDFVTQGALQDITAQSADIKPKYPAGIFQLVELGGRTWALPSDAGPQVMLYRKDLFDKHQIDVPKTWDEYRAAAQKVKKADREARIGSFFSDDPGLMAMLAWQAGGTWFGPSGDAWKVAIDDEPSKKAAAYWQDLVSDDLVKVHASWSQEWIASVAKDEVWSYVGANWAAGMVKSNNAPQSGKWAVAPAPNWGSPTVGMNGGTTLAVSKGSEHVEAAVKVAEWLNGSPESWKARLGSGTSSAFPAIADLVPVAAQSFDTGFYGGQDIYQVFRDSYATVRPGWTWGPSMTQVMTSFKDKLGQVSTGATTVPAVLTQVQADTVDEIKGRGLSVAS
ncbi:ABC transporter substrate-binding protein [Nonomuraea sp. NPDC004297]